MQKVQGIKTLVYPPQSPDLNLNLWCDGKKWLSHSLLVLRDHGVYMYVVYI